MESDNQLTTRTVDLLVPADRFAVVSRMSGRLHRWRLLLGKYWWIPALLTLGLMAAAYFWTHRAPPIYQSKARMWLAGKLDIREDRLYTEEAIDYLGTQAELLRSSLIQNRALARLTGAPVPTTKTNGGAGEAFPFTVVVEDARKSSILGLRVMGSEPAATRQFLNLLMEEYLSFKREARQSASQRTVASVTGQVSELARELEAQQEKLHAFQSSNNVVFLQEQGNSAGSYLAVLNRRLANLRTELNLLRAMLPEQWIDTKSRPETGPPGERTADEPASQEMLTSLAGPQLELFKASQQMQLLKVKRDELSRFLRPKHPKMVKLNQEIETQTKLAQMARDEAAKQLTHRRQALELEIKNLESASEEWDSRAIQASRKLADYDRLRQDAQRIQAAYNKMLALIETVDLGKTIDQENVGVLEHASAAVPLNRMMRNLAIALAGALLLGCGFLFLMERFRDDISCVGELQNLFSEPVLGQVPAVSRYRLNRHLEPGNLEGQRFGFLEAFRDIRSALLFMGNGQPRPRMILVASSVPAEGKSTIALYLAATMGLGNSRVLLVDGDMRQGALHKSLGVVSRPGLAEILNRECSPADAIIPTALDNLHFLPAGEATRNPGELVLSSEWPGFLAAIREQFDFVLFDTPPVSAASDAVVLAPALDGVLFVVRASYTGARTAGGALAALRQRHARILGLILNRTVASAYDNYGYQRYQDDYRWRPRATRSPTLRSAVVGNQRGP